ncbi:MAG: glycosyltransferase family 4 protein [Bryobacteraceae bacterium]|nr:glycosyltransferase family 4 protein [Bryobacteraceae bacterium]
MARVTFILPVKGGGGGAHSVVQEATAMRSLGVDATIFVNEKNFSDFKRTYARFEWIANDCKAFKGPKDLAELIDGSDIVIATTNTSAHSIAEAVAIGKKPQRTGYYVQDYEPLFYEVGTEPYNLAVSSFDVLKDCTYFAKTRWLRDIVDATHRHPVSVVVPSIDMSIYHPVRRPANRNRTICAMVRPQTPRRAPHRTMRVLARVAAQFGEDVEISIFGADLRDLEAHNVQTYPGIEILGSLLQPQVASLLQRTDFFLDLSDYQAFGRTAAEAMACGTIALAPAVGGASDFIVDGHNSFLVDTRDEGAVLTKVERMLTMTDEEIRLMRIAALEAVSGFTPTAAAVSELRAFGFA